MPAISGIGFSLNQFFWFRKFGLILGHTAGAVAAVLVAGSIGLAIGAWAAGALRSGVGREPWRRSARWQAAAAGACLLLNTALAHGGYFLPPLIGGSDVERMGGWVIALALLVLPSTLLGAAFPLTAAAAVGTEPAPRREAWLRYCAVQSAGNLLGALLYLWILPRCGDAAFVTAMGAVGFLGAALAHWAAPADGARGREASAPPALGLRAAWGLLFLSGAAAMLSELAWVRSLSVVLGSTSASRAMVLAALSFWFSVGCWAATRAAGAKRPVRDDWFRSLLGALIGLGLYSAVINRLPYLFSRGAQVLAGGPARDAALVFVLASLLVAIPAFFMGSTFSLGLMLGGGGLSPVARAFAAGAVGNAVGAAVALFALLPGGGPARALSVAAGLYAAAAVGALFKGRSWGGPAAVVAVAGGLSLIGLRGTDDRVVLSAAYYCAPIYRPIQRYADYRDVFGSQRVLFDAEGFSSRVTVLETPTGIRSLRVDGRSEAADRPEAEPFRDIARLPLALAPRPPRRALVIGLGSGATVGALTTAPSIERVDVVEIEPLVLDAAKHFAEQNEIFWESPAFRLIPQDARRFVAGTASRYDLIASQPSPVWVSGAGAMFTREAFALIRRRLNAGGVFCQWLNAYGLETEDLKTLAKTFLSVFPQAALYRVDAPHLLLVGSNGAMASVEAGGKSFQRLLSGDALARWSEGGRIYTDSRPFLEFKSASTVSRGLTPLGLEDAGETD